MKGNKQRAEYRNLEGRHEKSGRRERGNRGSESGVGHRRSHCEAKPGREERKKQRLSSRNRKRSRRKEAERKGKAQSESGRAAPEEQLWERIGEGRKETNRKLSTRTWKEGMRNQAGEKGETEEARAESGTGEAAARRNREEKERKSRG